MQYRNDRNGDVITVPSTLIEKYDALKQWTRVVKQKNTTTNAGTGDKEK